MNRNYNDSKEITENYIHGILLQEVLLPLKNARAIDTFSSPPMPSLSQVAKDVMRYGRLNPRQWLAVNMYNKAIRGSHLPEVEISAKGYEQAGRGEGILRTLSQNEQYFYNVASTPEFKNFFKIQGDYAAKAFGKPSASELNFQRLASTPEGRRGLLYTFFKSVGEGVQYTY